MCLVIFIDSVSSLIVFNVIAGPFASLTCLSVLTIRMMFRTLNGLIMGVFERFVFIVLFHIINDVFKKAVHPNIIRPTIILAIFHLFIFHTIKALTSQS